MGKIGGKREVAMKYLLQTVNGEIKDIEVFNLKKLIDERGRLYFHEYRLSDKADGKDLEGYIPVGTLEFVGDYLKAYYGIDHINPIEIPKEMRNKDYVGRYYKILRKEDLPNRGFSFIKNVTKLKVYTGFMAVNESTKDFLEGEIFQVSDTVNFISEYRVFVLNEAIQAIQHYMGDVLVFPNISVIKEIVSDYTSIEGSSKAFTVDVGIDDKGRTFLIEIHNFNSCGTYGFYEMSLLEMYRLGFDYLINSNKNLELDDLTIS